MQYHSHLSIHNAWISFVTYEKQGWKPGAYEHSMVTNVSLGSKGTASRQVGGEECSVTFRRQIQPGFLGRRELNRKSKASDVCPPAIPNADGTSTCW